MDLYNVLVAQIETTRRGSEEDRPKPHKLIMLLAVLDLADDGLLRNNEIHFDTPLIERFHRHFAPVARGNDWSQPALPFFHLRSSDFWFHKIKTGREAVYSSFTTSGGGSKRILENIEYAYLSSEAFQVVSDASLRPRLRSFLLGALPTMDKVSITTHESFSLNRPALSQLLRLAIEHEHSSDTKKRTSHDIHQSTSLGTRQVKAARIYAKSSGLITEQDTPTRFGKIVYHHDPGLSAMPTLWGLHYHLTYAPPHNHNFWRHLVIECFHPGSSLRPKELSDQIKQFHLNHEETPLAVATYERAAIEFLGTYAKQDGLGGLGILNDSNLGEYLVGDPSPAPWPVVAYAMADTWAGAWGDRATVNLEQTRELGTLFMLGNAALNARLRTMQERGMIEVQRRVPPYQVTRLALDPMAALEHLYERDDHSE